MKNKDNQTAKRYTSQQQRHLCALLMILAMIGISEWSGEKEIIFPEMAALTIGMWIIDKRVWIVSRERMLCLMTLGALCGICIVRYSPFHLFINLGISFALTAFLMIISRTTLIPAISACMLPVLLKTESWVYPVAVFSMSVIVITGQYIMEKKGIRQKIDFIPAERNFKKDIERWFLLLSTFLIIAAVPVFSDNIYCILPPLVVSYVEFANSKAGFRNRPGQIYIILLIGACTGTLFQGIGHNYIGIPEWGVACAIFLSLFALFEQIGKYYAPAGAVALIPMIIPQEDLVWFPLQVAIGAALFIGTSLILFQQCLKWSKAQWMICIIPEYIRRRYHNKV